MKSHLDKLDGAMTMTDDDILHKVAEVLGNPLLFEDLKQDFTVHTEAGDWIKFARALLSASEPAAPMTPRYIVIGYGETDYPQATLVNERERLLDAVLGMMYTSPSDADAEIREAYGRDLDDPDEWSHGHWNTEFEIGGITVYDLGGAAAQAQSGEPEFFQAEHADAAALRAFDKSVADGYKHDVESYTAGYVDCYDRAQGLRTAGAHALRDVITNLRETGRYVDEEGEATDALESLLLAVSHATPAQSGEPVATTERGVIENLLTLASAAFQALDNSEERAGDDGREHAIDATWFDPLCDALDKLEELPDDQPGYTMHAPAKAAWALRGLLKVAATKPAQTAHPDRCYAPSCGKWDGNDSCTCQRVAQPAQTERTYTTQPGESVMGIALRQCGDEAEWRHILACNPKFADLLPSDYFPVGTVLTLPGAAQPASGGQE